MKRLRAELAASALLALLLGCADSPPRYERIVLVSLDTLRADYLSAYGSAIPDTSPNLDAFAAENLRFENAFVAEPSTLSSHMSLFTGLVPHRHGVRDDRRLDDSLPTLAEQLQRAGFRTHAIVDGGYVRRHWGFDRGFDAFEEHPQRGFEASLPRAIEWLEARGPEPFFLFLHSYDVHSDGFAPFYDSPNREDFTRELPSRLRSEDAETFRRRFHFLHRGMLGGLDAEDLQYIRASYAAGVRYADEQVGELLAALHRLGLYDDTLVVIWSDHGEGLFDHEGWAHGELFDHTIRVPLLMRIPGWRPARARSFPGLVASTDLLPTLLELAGLPVPPGLDGRSLLPRLADPDAEHADRTLFSRKIVGGLRRFSIRTATHHYIRDESAERSWFFDLREDPQERSNLSPSGSDEEQRLAARLDAWIAEHDAAWEAAGDRGVSIDGEAREQLRALGYLDAAE